MIDSVIRVEITKEAYLQEKEQQLRNAPPILRSYLRNVGKLLSDLDPEDVIDSIEEGTTIKDVVRKNKILRLRMAGAKGALKYVDHWRDQVDRFITMDNVRLILRFENPSVHEVIDAYGGEGKGWLEMNVSDLRSLILKNDDK